MDRWSVLVTHRRKKYSMGYVQHISFNANWSGTKALQQSVSLKPHVILHLFIEMTLKKHFRSSGKKPAHCSSKLLTQHKLLHASWEERSTHILAPHPAAGHLEVVLPVVLRVKGVLGAGVEQRPHRLVALKHQIDVAWQHSLVVHNRENSRRGGNENREAKNHRNCNPHIVRVENEDVKNVQYKGPLITELHRGTVPVWPLPPPTHTS